MEFSASLVSYELQSENGIDSQRLTVDLISNEHWPFLIGDDAVMCHPSCDLDGTERTLVKVKALLISTDPPNKHEHTSSVSYLSAKWYRLGELVFKLFLPGHQITTILAHLKDDACIVKLSIEIAELETDDSSGNEVWRIEEDSSKSSNKPIEQFLFRVIQAKPSGTREFKLYDSMSEESKKAFEKATRYFFDDKERWNYDRPLDVEERQVILLDRILERLGVLTQVLLWLLLPVLLAILYFVS